MSEYLITRHGFDKLRAELDNFKNNKRPNISKRIAEARDFGDLKENAEYHSAREEQGFIEAKISQLESILSSVKVVDVNNITSSQVKFGATVEIEDVNTNIKRQITIVSEYEADASKNLVSCNAPIVKQMLNKEVGDEFKLNNIEYQITSINYN